MEREPIYLVAWRLNRVFPLVVCGLALLNLIVYLSLNYLVVPQRVSLEKQLVDLQTRVRQARQTDTEAKTPAEVYRRGKADLLKFREAIPTKSEFPALLAEIFSLAGRSGLVIDKIGYTPKEIEDQSVLRYGMAFSVEGDYGQVKRFISALEQSSRLIVIDDLSLSGDQEAGNSKVELSLKLATFFQSEAS